MNEVTALAEPKDRVRAKHPGNGLTALSTTAVREACNDLAATLANVDGSPQGLIESDAVGEDPWPAVQRWVADHASAGDGTRGRPTGRTPTTARYSTTICAHDRHSATCRSTLVHSSASSDPST